MDKNDLVPRIRRYDDSYKRTGLIGVYDHVLLKDLVAAADEIQRLHDLHLDRTKLTTKVIQERDSLRVEIEHVQKRGVELAETVAMRFGIEPVPGNELQSVLYYLRSLPTDDNGVYVHLVGHKPGELLKEQEMRRLLSTKGADDSGQIVPTDPHNPQFERSVLDAAGRGCWAFRRTGQHCEGDKTACVNRASADWACGCECHESEQGEIVNPTVHAYAPEPKPDFERMQRTIESGKGTDRSAFDMATDRVDGEVTGVREAFDAVSEQGND